MRVGVEEAVHQDLLEIRAEYFFGERGAVEFNLRERAQLGDFFPGHELHREDARGAVIGDRGGNDNARERAELFAQGREIARFLPIIEFLQKAATELLEELAEFV